MSQTKVKSGLLNFPDQTDFVKLPSGTTAQRPSSPEKGYSRYNTTDNKLEFWNGTVWQQLPGVVAPTIETVSYPGDDLAADPVGGQTITLTGTNFLAGASVEISGTLASVVTVVSKTEITFTAPAKAAGDYDILLTNGDNTTATFVNGMSYNGVPSWTTAAGNLGSFPAGSTIPTITLVATEPDSGVISYSVTTGALPTGLALTGADIDGSVPSPAGETTYNFSVTASDDENQESTERAFNIVVYLQVTNTVSSVDPFGDSSAIRFYQLDGNTVDLAGNYDGVSRGISYVDGVFGQGAYFSSNGNINSGYSPSGSFSISGWQKQDASGYDFCNTQNSNGDQGIIFRGFRSGTVAFIDKYGGGNNYAVHSVNVSQNNSWHHFVLSFTNNNNCKIYMDGVLIMNFNSALSQFVHSTTLDFGEGDYTSQDPTGISLDQIRIFNRAITPLEVSSLYEERTVVCGGQADTLDILGDNSCIATYQLDGNANDLSGNYSGTPTDVSYGVGEFDLAGVFNGSNSGINLPSSLNTSVIDATGAFSISMWINANDVNTIQYLFCSNNSNNVDLGINSNGQGVGKIVWVIYNTSYSYLVSTATITINTWYNIAVTYNNGSSELFINGVSQGTSIKTLLESSIEPTLGYRNTGGSVRFNGSIDQVRIFNKALNSTEVTTLYNETACDALACSGTTNTLQVLGDSSCIAAYPLDGSPADLSGNYNGVQTDVTYPVGKYDLAASFNGSSSSIDSGYSLPASSDSSFSLWFKTSNTSTKFLSTQGVVTGSANQLSIAIVSSGTRLEIQVGNSYIDFAGNITNGAWHNFVFSRNASSGYTLYLDGSFLGTFSNTTALQSANLFLGTRSDNTSLTFDGQIDQARFFNKALSAGEVTTLYNETACN